METLFAIVVVVLMLVSLRLVRKEAELREANDIIKNYRRNDIPARREAVINHKFEGT